LAAELDISVAPVNPGARLDLFVGDTTNVERSVLAPVVTAKLARDRNLASWFVIVDRVVRPRETLVLETLFHGVTRSTSQSGSPKYGYRTMYNTGAQITFTLVDMASGDILASASASGSTTDSNGHSRADDYRAFEYAIVLGLNRLVSQYAGR
jgi:hypothetical protein